MNSNLPLPSHAGRAGALEHVVMGVYSHRYQPAPAAQSLPEPKGKDLIVGIDDDGPYPADEQLNRPEDWGHELILYKNYAISK